MILIVTLVLIGSSGWLTAYGMKNARDWYCLHYMQAVLAITEMTKKMNDLRDGKSLFDKSVESE